MKNTHHNKIRDFRYLFILLLIFPISTITCLKINAENTIELKGRWLFAIDRNKEGERQQWYNRILSDSYIKLPGSMDEAGFGDLPPKVDIHNQWTFGLKRPVVYEGVAWYQRDVIIPKEWSGKHIELFLEQTRSETTLWIDSCKLFPSQNSLATSHRHDLTKQLTPGNHRITIMLNNENVQGIGGSYMRSSMGQGNWQGIAGCIELRATDPVWIDNVQFIPRNKEKATIEVTLSKSVFYSDVVRCEAIIENNGKVLEKKSFIARFSNDCTTARTILDISKLKMWDEFTPQLYNLNIYIHANNFKDSWTDQIGVRFVETNSNHQIVINGRPIFLRGTVNYNIFPLTGYPSTNVDEWTKIFGVYKEWGMNHVRFHSLCPPHAAFVAADRMGIYLQCEAPKAGIVGKNKMNDDFQIIEGKRILKEYGNHPSFVLMSMGNELSGSDSSIQNIYDQVSKGDTRRLFTATTGGAKEEFIDNYKIFGGIVRGFKGPFTNWNYTKVIEHMNVPIISHEVGQWHIYPDVFSIEKYKGILQAENLEIIRKDLERKGLLNHAHDFTQVTGAFSSLLYKDEMEGIMRTPNYGGYQILMLNDFPSQGTAHCGMLDVFNEPKGFITAERYREFCSPIVPLLELEKRVYTNTERFSSKLDMANYTPEKMKDALINWEIRGLGKVYDRGTIRCKLLENNNVFEVGHIESSLEYIKTAQKLEVFVEIGGTNYKNRWNIWVFPENKSINIPNEIKVTSKWKEACEYLAKGEKVLLFASTQEMRKWRPGQFKTVFWSPIWLQRGIETMSILADVNSPVFKSFPTEKNTDWQWFDILENSCTIAIDDLPINFNPIIYVIDSFRKNQRLSNMLEAKVGEGRLLLTTINLKDGLENDVARRGLLSSLIEYMSSEDFNPEYTLETADINKLFDCKIKSSTTEFTEISTAQINVKSGNVIKIDKGFSYTVNSDLQKSGTVTAWADKRDIWIKIQCPESLEGTLYVKMLNSSSSNWGMLKTPQELLAVDWVEESFENHSNKKPVAAILINDEYMETIHQFGYGGRWYAIPVKKDQMKAGKIELQISTFNYPNILEQFAFKAI